MAASPPDGGEAGATFPGEVLRAPESLPTRVTVPGAPSPFPPAAPAEPAQDASSAAHRRRHRKAG